MPAEKIQPTQHVCPSSTYDDSHHLVPKPDGKGQWIQRCRYCGKTEKEVIEEIAFTMEAHS